MNEGTLNNKPRNIGTVSFHVKEFGQGKNWKLLIIVNSKKNLKKSLMKVIMTFNDLINYK